MINLDLENSCFRRAIFAGLRYSGIQDDCSWIPISPTGRFANEVIKRYPFLKIHDQGTVNFENNPVFVVYDTKTKDTNGDLIKHAAFISDAGVFNVERDIKVSLVISGWETKISLIKKIFYFFRSLNIFNHEK